MKSLSFKPLLIVAGLGLATALPAHAAGMVLGGSAGSARVNGGDFDGSDTGWKAFVGGYGQYLGGEIAYVNFGRLGGDRGPEANAWAPAVTLGIPVGMASFYGKLGAAFADVEGSSVREEYKDETPFYGVGARFGDERGLGLRVEYERYELEREDVDQASLGLEFRFQ